MIFLAFKKTWALKNHLGVIWIYWHGCSKLYDNDDHKYGAAAHGLKPSFCLIGISRPLEPTEARTSFLHGLYTNFLKGSSKVYKYILRSSQSSLSCSVLLRQLSAATCFSELKKAASENHYIVTNNRIAIWRVFSLHESCNECNIYAGLSSLGVPGVPWHTQNLADQFTLFQPGGDRLCPPNYYWHTRIFRPSDGPEAIW